MIEMSTNQPAKKPATGKVAKRRNKPANHQRDPEQAKIVRGLSAEAQVNTFMFTRAI